MKIIITLLLAAMYAETKPVKTTYSFRVMANSNWEDYSEHLDQDVLILMPENLGWNCIREKISKDHRFGGFSCMDTTGHVLSVEADCSQKNYDAQFLSLTNSMSITYSSAFLVTKCMTQ